MSARVITPLFALLLVATVPSQSSASTSGETFPATSWAFSATTSADGDAAHSRADRMWRVSFDAPAPSRLTIDPPAGADQARTQAVQYSDAYNTRRKIHMYASYATLPLFALQYVSGERLYDGKEGGLADAHGLLAGSVATLFGVNTVTGVWNLWEARSDPNGRTRRLIHGILMLGADAGFAATGMLAPDDDDPSGKSTHRTIALTSMGVATAGYLYMLFTR